MNEYYNHHYIRANDSGRRGRRRTTDWRRSDGDGV